MVRWIAFDDETAEAVVSRFKRGAAEIEAGDPLAAALGADRPTMVILPSQVKGRVLLAKISPSKESVNYEATGFLGLSDEPVAPRAPQPQARKSWWKKLGGRF